MAEATRSGRWIHRDADIHRCNKPPYNSTVKIGDKWQCNTCNVIWRVKGFDSGVQWDPYPTQIRWERHEEHGVYAPGTR